MSDIYKNRHMTAINSLHPSLALLRREIHKHPELGYFETVTSACIADRLRARGLEVMTGIGKTGVIGTLRRGSSKKSIYLRADMDALPIEEISGISHCSENRGVMHACGHDGHIAMLLGAMEILASLDGLDGTIHFVFQPAEEMGAGARAMLEDGLLDRFPAEKAFAIHNWPDMSFGKIHIGTGAVMASADTFEIVITGKGAHAAYPHQGRDVIAACTALLNAIQAIVSREISANESAVISVTKINAGTALNILPEQATIAGTVRTLSPQNQSYISNRLHEICEGIAITSQTNIEISYNKGYPPTINHELAVKTAIKVAENIFGTENVLTKLPPSMGSEDFSFISEEIPSCYAWLGSAKSSDNFPLHNPRYDFNDDVIPYGVAFFVGVAEAELPSAKAKTNISI